MLNRRITKDIWKAFGILHASFTCVSFHYACMNTKQCFIFKFKEEDKTYSKSLAVFLSLKKTFIRENKPRLQVNRLSK